VCPVTLGVTVWLTDRSVGVTELACAVERAGLESLFLTSHTHVPASRRDILADDDRQDARLLDQFTALGAAAAVTSHLRLGTCVCIVPQHDPIVLAKQVATIDHLSGGRFVFGIGAGWVVEEMRNHGVEPRLRWRLMREQILAMQAIWTRDEAEFHGEHVNFDPICSWPKPVQEPHPPVLVGAIGPAGLRAVVEYGDGWMPVVDELAPFGAALGRLRQLAADAGRAEPEVTACFFDLDEGLLAGCAELGVTRFVVRAPASDLTALETFLDRYSETAGRVAE
jgi:probable F420-dependent oxidoreductase